MPRVSVKAANDNRPFAIVWCARTMLAVGISRNRLIACLEPDTWPRCPCCGREMSLLSRDELP
jgi:hypothetical protein